MNDVQETAAPASRDAVVQAQVTDLVVRLAFLGLFAYWSLTLVAPFFSVLIWAVIITVALYPVYEWLGHRLGGRRGLAALLLTLVALCVVGGRSDCSRRARRTRCRSWRPRCAPAP